MFPLPEGRPALMGIINVTPDSFSDGGVHFAAASAIEAGKRMMDEGADLIDVGGESTRPGAAEVPEHEEIARVVPVVEALAQLDIPVSIDTMKPGVAEAALDVGAVLVNDVTALINRDMLALCASRSCTVCLMHMQGTPRNMQANPTYGDVVAEVRHFLLQRASLAEQAGIDRTRIWIDPGIGFGKNLNHNLTLLRHLETFVDTGYPVLVGVSRKSFLGKLLQGAPPDDRLEATLAAQVWAQMAGARIIRAHDVKQARRAIDVAAAIARA